MYNKIIYINFSSHFKVGALMNKEKKPRLLSNNFKSDLGIILGIASVLVALAIAVLDEFEILHVILTTVVLFLTIILSALIRYIVNLRNIYSSYDKLWTAYEGLRVNCDSLNKRHKDIKNRLKLMEDNNVVLKQDMYNMLELTVFYERLKTTEKKVIVDNFYKNMIDEKRGKENDDE